MFKSFFKMYADSVKCIRNDLPLIFNFLYCFFSLLTILALNFYWGKFGGMSGGFMCITLRYWFNKWLLK